MKQLRTVMAEATEMADKCEHYADLERTGEISRRTYFRAAATESASRSAAERVLRENYQRAGLAHLF